MPGKLRLKRQAPEAGDAGALACAVCRAPLGSMDAAARAAHVNACIDAVDGRAAGVDDASSCACAVCGRDLSGYSESARLHHANRCCDSLSDRPASEPAASSPTALPSPAPSASPAPAASCHCVVCGKDITKLKNQTEHMKRCAKRTGMPAARLLELTRCGAGAGGPAASKTARQPDPQASRKKPREHLQQRLASGKENALGVIPATAAAHMPTDSAIVTWLRQAGLAKYCPIFLREEIDLEGATPRSICVFCLRLQRLA